MKLLDSHSTLNLDEELIISLTVRELLELHVSHAKCYGSDAKSYCEDLGFDYDEIDSGVRLYREIKDILGAKGIIIPY